MVARLVRDQKAAGSNPATSTPGSVDFPTLPGFLFLAKVPVFSGLQPAGLQRGGKAPCGELENTTSVNFRKFPVFSSVNFAGLKNVGGFRLPLYNFWADHSSR